MIISGIQQVGIGVQDIHAAWKWYAEHLGFDVKVFEEKGTASLMAPYMGNKSQLRHSGLGINLQGGGGLEFVQHLEREQQEASWKIKLGDYGIYCLKIRVQDAEALHKKFSGKQLNVITPVLKNPLGVPHFFIRDPFENLINIVEDASEWYLREGKPTGGAFGAVLGCSDLDKSLKFFAKVFGYDWVKFRDEKVFQDFVGIPGGDSPKKRAILSHLNPRQGRMSGLLGRSELELVENSKGEGQKIYKNRMWGDLGYIHLAFDVWGLDEIEARCERLGFPFTVNSKIPGEEAFRMEKASGHFAYVEDPDGTLIEMIETLKIPLLNRFGINLSMKLFSSRKHLPKPMIAMMKRNRYRENI